MKSLALLVALFAVTCLPCSAAQWNVDYAKSKLGFTVLWGKEPFSAAFKTWKADIAFDPTDLAHARADVTIDLSSEESDEPDFDSGLKGALGFQVSQYRTSQFATTGFVHKSGDDYVATGHLTIRGTTKTITLPFTLTLDGNHAHMKGAAEVIRTDYGVGSGMWSAPTPVAHNVTVTIDLFAIRS